MIYVCIQIWWLGKNVFSQKCAKIVNRQGGRYITLLLRDVSCYIF